MFSLVASASFGAEGSDLLSFSIFVGLSVGLSVELSIGLSVELSIGLSVELGLSVCT
jgi:hypothetical protein